MPFKFFLVCELREKNQKKPILLFFKSLETFHCLKQKSEVNFYDSMRSERKILMIDKHEGNLRRVMQVW